MDLKKIKDFLEVKNTELTKKDVIVLIRELHKRFMKMDFLLYTESPKEPKEFYTTRKNKIKYKKIFFNYKRNFQVIYELNEYEYRVWRANFPMQSVTTKRGKENEQ